MAAIRRGAGPRRQLHEGVLGPRHGDILEDMEAAELRLGPREAAVFGFAEEN